MNPLYGEHARGLLDAPWRRAETDVDGDGDVDAVVSREVRLDGRLQRLVFDADADGRPERTVRFGYDAAGRVVDVFDESPVATTRLAYFYDAQGRVAKEAMTRRHLGGPERTVVASTTYDENGLPARLELREGDRLVREQIHDDGGRVVERRSFDEQGRVVEEERVARDAAGRALSTERVRFDEGEGGFGPFERERETNAYDPATGVLLRQKRSHETRAADAWAESSWQVEDFDRATGVLVREERRWEEPLREKPQKMRHLVEVELDPRTGAAATTRTTTWNDTANEVRRARYTSSTSDDGRVVAHREDGDGDGEDEIERTIRLDEQQRVVEDATIDVATGVMHERLVRIYDGDRLAREARRTADGKTATTTYD